MHIYQAVWLHLHGRPPFYEETAYASVVLNPPFREDLKDKMLSFLFEKSDNYAQVRMVSIGGGYTRIPKGKCIFQVKQIFHFLFGSLLSWDQARVIKLFFMLNSTEHEILNAHKYKV